MSETKTINAEINDPSTKLTETIEALGIEVSSDRLSTLNNTALECLEKSTLTGFKPTSFNESRLFIHKPNTDDYGTTTSKVDYLPRTEKNRGATLPQRGESTTIALRGLIAFQDFAILAEAGFIEPPDRLAGSTNDAMARIAERIGFERQGQWEISAPYTTIRDRLFSPDILRVQEVLEKRIMKIRAKSGELAISNAG